MTDRDIDLKWINENLATLTLFARTNYQTVGRGVLVIDHSESGKTDPPVDYLPLLDLPADDEDTRRMVREYDPSEELIVLLMKPDDLVSSYRLTGAAKAQ